MSYDTYIMIDTGGDDHATVAECGNYTSNVWPMFHRAMPGPFKGGGRYYGTGDSDPRGGLPGLSGLPCTDAAPILNSAIEYMERHAATLRELELENGWGDFDGALQYLRDIYSATLRHPKGYVAVSW